MAEMNSYGATPYASYKLKLTSEPWEGGDWRNKPDWNLDIVNNNPRITIWPRNPKEAEKTNRWGKPLANTPINALMGPVDLQKFFILMEEVLSSTEPAMWEMLLRGQKYDVNNNVIKGEMEVNCIFTFGRDPEGNVYLALQEKYRDQDGQTIKRDKVIHRFRPNPWVSIRKEGQDLNKAEDSTLEARAWFAAISKLWAPLTAQYYVPQNVLNEARKEKQGFGNKKPAPAATPKAKSSDGFDFDEDIPDFG